MGFLPNVMHDNSGSISINQINRFKGYNHNKVISDNEFYDMENVTGNDYPALSVRKGRSEYKWSYADAVIRICYAVAVAAYYSIYPIWYISNKGTWEEFLADKGKMHLASEDTYAEHIKAQNEDFFTEYFSGSYNGSIDYDGLCIVKGPYMYYDGTPICELTDSKKLLVPLGGKIAVFPDKQIVDIEGIKGSSKEFSAFLQTNEVDFSDMFDDFVPLCLEFFSSYVKPMEMSRCYVGTDGKPSDANLLANTDFSGISGSFTNIKRTVEQNLGGGWYLKAYVKHNANLTVEECTFEEKECIKVELDAAGGTIDGIYRKISYTPCSDVTFKLSLWARTESETGYIKPYISIGDVKFNLGHQFNFDSSGWHYFEFEKTISVPESGEFIVSIDAGSVGKTVYIAEPECKRVLTDAEEACTVEMTHYTLSGFSSSDMGLDDDFRQVGENELKGFDNTLFIGESGWQVCGSVGANTSLTIGTDNCFGTCLTYELSSAATIKGIFNTVEYTNTGKTKSKLRVRFSFYAKADRNKVPIKPYISGSNTVAIDKGSTFYLTTEWQKIQIEKTIDISDVESGVFTVSFDGISAGSARKVWFSQPTVYEIASKNIGKGFKQLDGVHLKVEYVYDGQTYEAEHDAVIYNISDDGAVLTFNDYALLTMFPEDCVYYEQQPDGTQLAVPKAKEILLTNLEISRFVPDIEYACSSHNKIFGVNTKENAIYACYYNDASNWNFFEGIAADSFYGECTSPGKFTGAIAYNDYPLFFKEKYLITVYGNDSSEFYLSEKFLSGVEEGSEKSLISMNGVVFYKSAEGIMSFSGGLPVNISEEFGNEKYTGAVAGADGRRFYVSMLDEKENHCLFFYDSDVGCWYKEDSIRASDFINTDNKLILIEENSGDTIELNSDSSNENVEWFIETGDLYDSSACKKYIWRLMLRIGMSNNTKVRLLLQYNSSGLWEEQKRFESSGRKTLSIPLKCNRTDHLRLRIEGKGSATIYSIARRLVAGNEL